MRTCLASFCLLPLLVACEEEKPKVEAKAAPAATAVAAATPTPSAAPAPAPTAEKPERPTKVETELSPARRSAVEAKYASAAGFLGAFDKAAQGKWVLFTGPLVNLTDDGFDVGIVYTPQLPNDPMGMSRQFFEVTLSKVEGYTKDAFKTGNVVVVLAKYNGSGKAGPGYELISTGVWK